MYFDEKVKDFRTTWMNDCIDRFKRIRQDGGNINNEVQEVQEEMFATAEEVFGDGLSPIIVEEIINSIIEDAKEYSLEI